MDTLTFQRFCSKLGMCRWRKLFTPTKHKVKGVQLQCRVFDIESLARDLKLDEPMAEVAQTSTQTLPEVPAVSKKRPLPAEETTAPKVAARCEDCGLWSQCRKCGLRDFNARKSQ